MNLLQVLCSFRVLLLVIYRLLALMVRQDATLSGAEQRAAGLVEGMGYRRPPTFLVNFPLRLMPFSEKQKKAFEAGEHIREVTFKTIPSIGKARCPPACWHPAVCPWRHKKKSSGRTLA